jgi:phosphoglycerate kinase
MKTIKQLTDMDLKNKRVLLRVDFDTPVDKKTGEIIDDSRIKISIPTINYILSKNPKQLILMWKLGRPKDNEFYLKTNKGASYLSKLIDEKVVKVDGWGEKELPDNKIIALENVRFHPDEKTNDHNKFEHRSKHLATLGDVFVNDAFAMAHRAECSTTGIMKYLPSCIGLNLKKEVDIIEKITKNPKKPLVAIIGGAKSDKIEVIDELLELVDHLIIGGVMANTFLKSKGVNIGQSKFDKESLGKAKQFLHDYGDKIELPIDYVCGEKFDESTKAIVIEQDDDINNLMIMDIGPKTIDKYIDILNKSNTVIWGGPIGVFEFPQFQNGTKQIAQTLANLDIVKVIGGGDSGEAIHELKLENKMTHVSSGGGAFLELLSGNKLPVIEELSKNSKRFK